VCCLLQRETKDSVVWCSVVQCGATAPHCATPHRTNHCTALRYSAPHAIVTLSECQRWCSVVQCRAVSVKDGAVWCGVVQCERLCSVVRCGAVSVKHTLQLTATLCNTLQLTATLCNTLQHRGKASQSDEQLKIKSVTMQHTAKHCNALQRTATHSHTLQHTATH